MRHDLHFCHYRCVQEQTLGVYQTSSKCYKNREAKSYLILMKWFKVGASHMCSTRTISPTLRMAEQMPAFVIFRVPHII